MTAAWFECFGVRSYAACALLTAAEAENRTHCDHQLRAVLQMLSVLEQQAMARPQLAPALCTSVTAALLPPLPPPAPGQQPADKAGEWRPLAAAVSAEARCICALLGRQVGALASRLQVGILSPNDMFDSPSQHRGFL